MNIGQTCRVEVEANVSQQPGGQDIRTFLFVVTRFPADEEPEVFGRPHAPDWDGYHFNVELISGDTDGASELVDLESEAIELAKTRWAEEHESLRKAE